jgi:hypothetical protein
MIVSNRGLFFCLRLKMGNETMKGIIHPVNPYPKSLKYFFILGRLI